MFCLTDLARVYTELAINSPLRMAAMTPGGEKKLTNRLIRDKTVI